MTFFIIYNQFSSNQYLCSLCIVDSFLERVKQVSMEATLMKKKNDKNRRSRINATYYKIHRNTIRENNRAKYKINVDSIRQQRQHRYKTNSDSIRDKSKAYYTINADTICQKKKSSYETNTVHVCKKRKSSYDANAKVICEKRKTRYHHSKSIGEQTSVSSPELRKTSSACQRSQVLNIENLPVPTNNQENISHNNTFLPRELNESEMEKNS